MTAKSLNIMKLHIKTLIQKTLIVSALVCGAFASKAQTQLLLDPNNGWVGYMNWFNLPSQGGAYVSGGVWGTGALTAYYNSATNELTLVACTNVWETTDGYWFQTNNADLPNKQMDASYYIQLSELGAGQTYTFSGNCISNTFNSSYTSTVFIKEFTSGYSLINSTTLTTTTGQPFSISLTTSGGTYIQYGFETIGPDQNPTNAYSQGEAIYQVQYPSVEPSPIASQAAVEGQSVSFTETPTGTGPFTYQWQLNGVNLANGGNISGATTNVLTISDATIADAGAISVLITNGVGSNAVANAYFSVTPLAQAQTNYCLDPSFESDTFAPDPSVGWYAYGGTAFVNTNDPYADFEPLSDPNVSVVDGTNCIVEYSAGANSYTGVYQNRPALPGQLYTASAWFYTPNNTDGNPVVNNASANLQIQFYNAGGTLLCDYESAYFTTNDPEEVWVQLPVTNKYAADFVTLLGTGPYIISPPGTASMRIQPGYHAPDAASGGDIYIDMVDVTLQETVPTYTLSGSTLKLSFPTVYGPQYNVLYTSDLSSGHWQILETITGDGTIKTATDTLGQKQRYYIINTQQ
jgi:Immunoglobulin I-set domain